MSYVSDYEKGRRIAKNLPPIPPPEPEVPFHSKYKELTHDEFKRRRQR